MVCGGFLFLGICGDSFVIERGMDVVLINGGAGSSSTNQKPNL